MLAWPSSTTMLKVQWPGTADTTFTPWKARSRPPCSTEVFKHLVRNGTSDFAAPDIVSSISATVKHVGDPWVNSNTAQDTAQCKHGPLPHCTTPPPAHPSSGARGSSWLWLWIQTPRHKEALASVVCCGHCWHWLTISSSVTRPGPHTLLLCCSTRLCSATTPYLSPTPPPARLAITPPPHRRSVM